MRSRFDMELEKLHDELVEMGNLIEASIETTVTAMREQDVELAKRVVEGDKEVNDLEKAIESRCLRLLLQQQPVASDLRMISSTLKMITDMERIGDQAADICEIIIMLDGDDYLKELVHIPQMAEAVVKMVKGGIDAFINRDLELVKEVIQYDDVVDDLFDVVKGELIQYIRNDEEKSEQAIDLMMIAKYFERIGDHAQNVAEWVYFSIKGEHYNGPK